MPHDDMILNDTAATATAHSALWRPAPAPRHRKPRGYRRALTVALLTVLGLLLTVALLFAAHVLVWYHARNAGFAVTVPFHPSWSVGYEYRGVPGFFTGDN